MTNITFHEKLNTVLKLFFFWSKKQVGCKKKKKKKKKSSARQHQWLNVALEALGTGVSGILGTSINALIIHGEPC